MLTYLKNRILEEINDALDYMKKAVEYKGTTDGCTFRKMSEMELEHANALTRMFKNTEKPSGMADNDYATTQKAVLDAYINAMGTIDTMKKLYWSEK